jgi:hypothetical protein
VELVSIERFRLFEEVILTDAALESFKTGRTVRVVY